jgi:hypothetical protein
VLVPRPVTLVVAYLSPTRLLTQSDLVECLSWGFPVFKGGDFNAQNTDWNSRLTTERVLLLRDYTSRIFCLIYGLHFPTTFSYQKRDCRWPTCASDCVLCAAFGSLTCLHRHQVSNIFPNPLSHPNFTRNEWLWDRFSGNLLCKRRESNWKFRRAAEQRQPTGHRGIGSQASTPAYPRPSLPACIQVGWGGSGKSRGIPLRKPRPTAQHQTVDDPSDPPVTAIVDEAICAHEYAVANETTLTSPSEVLQAIKVLRSAKLRARTLFRTGSWVIYLRARKRFHESV